MSTPADIGFSLNSPPLEAIAYLKQKGYALSFDYDELMHETHHHAFTVAKVAQLDLLTDIHKSLLQAQASGTPYQQWAKALIPTLIEKGWFGKTEVTNPDTGEVKTITVDGRRLSTIYHTNMNTSYAVARYRELNELPEEFAYWRYHAVMDARTRQTHAAKHGTILPKTSDWWKINYPPNGWRCRCKVFAYTKDDLSRKDWKVQEKDPPRIADVDWGYDIGAGSARIDQVYFQKARKILLDCKESNAKKELGCDDARIIFKSVLSNLNSQIDIAKAQAFIAGVYEIYKRENPKPPKEKDYSELKNFSEKPIVGTISLSVFEFLVTQKIITDDPFIYMTQNSIAHSVRDGKVGELTLDELLQVITLLKSEEIYWDTKNKRVVYATTSDDKKIKIAVAVNYEKSGLNEIRTMMFDPLPDFEAAVKGGKFILIK